MIELSIFAATVATKARSRAKAVCVLPRKWALRAAYHRGRIHSNTTAPALEPAPLGIIELGQSLYAVSNRVISEEGSCSLNLRSKFDGS
jgi:hypothetical protein